MPLLETKGAASAQGFGEFAKSGPANYIEDVFQTWLYTGNSTTGGSQTITNNVDLSTKGGLVWIKGRSAASDHILTDTARGAGVSATNNNAISSNSGNPEDLNGNTYDYLSAFGTTGFTVTQGGDVTGRRGTNYNAVTYASWTFRKQPKFFDIVTYTGTGVARTISHNLGSVPGCIIVKDLTSSRNWNVYHRSLGNTKRILLNDTSAELTGTTEWNSTTPTATEFSLGTSAQVNANGNSYVAYLFAHDAGGFGLTGNDNVISCGSFTQSSLGTATVTLGYEPQWILVKANSNFESWYLVDNMRGMGVAGNQALLFAESSTVESTNSSILTPTATGFVTKDTLGNSIPYIYIAIRRGPMKVPTDATKVFSPVRVSETSTQETSGGTFPPDLVNTFSLNGTDRTSKYNQFQFLDRLRSIGTPGNTFSTSTAGISLISSSTAAEGISADSYVQLKANSIDVTRGAGWSGGNYGNYIYYFMRRAPGFFDVVCYTGTGSNTTQTHNLGVVPELMIVKRRGATADWQVYSAALSNTEYLVLNSTAAKATGATLWNSTTPTASVFSLGTDATVNASGSTGTYVAYLFATCSGVSKVGSYTGTGNTLQIDCGFTGGARFVLIKRTDSTGDWYVWDSARGIVAGNDPYLLLNSTAVEVTNTDWVDTHNPGFELSNAAGNNVNINTATYLFLAIA